MPTTRSSTRIAANSIQRVNVTTESSDAKGDAPKSTSRATTKKRIAEDASDTPRNQKKSRKAAVEVAISMKVDEPLGSPGEEDTDAVVPAVLTFSLDEAKQHLISVDHRFEDLFNKLACKPYENLERFHPFHALSTSILVDDPRGQQISWLAARSIIHKFKRLYDPTLPEKPGEMQSNSFPTPAQVAATDLSTLRSAGLSARKAEYIQDLAKRFTDGRLSTRRILSATDEELAKMLIEVRGIGRWTVDMFAIFSLRRPDILPVGDLGVQRGLARWFLALHSPSDPFSISPEKISQSSTKKAEANSKRIDNDDSDDDTDEGYLPVIGETSGHDNSGPSHYVEDQKVDGLNGFPPVFTPSISKTLRNSKGTEILPLPKTLSVSELRSRISGKKKIKGALLTPQEMEILTENWKPYRSIGVYYMWSLASGE